MNRPDSAGDTALTKAAGNGHDKCVNLLIKAGANVNKQGEDVNTALVNAIINGHEKCVNLLLKAGAGVNLVCGSETALTAVAGSGHHKCLELLIKAGSDVNGLHGKDGDNNEDDDDDDGGGGDGDDDGGSYDSDTVISGSTRLITTIDKGHWECAKLLVKAGADVNITTKGGAIAIATAAAKGCEQCVKLLIDSAANLDETTDIESEYFGSQVWSAVIAAASNDCEGTLDLLLKAFTDADGEALLKASMYYRIYVLYVIARSHHIDRQYDSSK